MTGKTKTTVVVDDELKKAIMKSIENMTAEDWEKFVKDKNKAKRIKKVFKNSDDEPLSRRIHVITRQSVYDKLAKKAKNRGISVNNLINQMFEEFTKDEEKTTPEAAAVTQS